MLSLDQYSKLWFGNVKTKGGLMLLSEYLKDHMQQSEEQVGFMEGYSCEGMIFYMITIAKRMLGR